LLARSAAGSRGCVEVSKLENNCSAADCPESALVKNPEPLSKPALIIQELLWAARNDGPNRSVDPVSTSKSKSKTIRWKAVRRSKWAANFMVKTTRICRVAQIVNINRAPRERAAVSSRKFP
jgi:hypothetical protein